MAETLYFMQGGRKIEVRQDDAAITIHADDPAEARERAMNVGVGLRTAETAAPGLVRAVVEGDRDKSMSNLRADNMTIHHVYRDNQSPETEYLITESFFIKFKPETPAQRISDYFATERLVVEQDLGDKTYLVKVTDATGRNPIRTANAAASRDDVEYAEPNLVRQLTRFYIPTDTLFSKQWHLHSPVASPPDLVQDAGIFAPQAWDVTRGRREIVIAVADDGFDLLHPDFQGDGKIVAQLNATIRGNSINAGIEWDEDVHPHGGAAPYDGGDYHGTPCLGVAVAEGNGTGVVGVAPGCALVAVRFPLSMSDAHFIVMFQKISTLADVMSCSWGYGPANAPMSTALRDAITRVATTGGRRGKGLVICIAAGNNNCPVQDLTNTRTYRYRTGSGIVSYSGPIDRWIAAHPNVITVSASTSRKTRAAYSSWGKQICVCAPSNNFDDLGQVPAPGLGITTTDNENFGYGTDFSGGSRYTSRFGGTSSATPAVAGVCGLILSANSALSAAEVKSILQTTTDKNLSLVTDTPVNAPGDFDNTGFSLWFGWGKVNALKAVQEAVARTQQDGRVSVEAKPDLDIPDVGAPIQSVIQINQAGKITDIRVQIDITHTYIGDLRVDLTAPDGRSVVLHNNTGGSANDLKKIYSIENLPALRAFVDLGIKGRWQLSVRDTFGFDVGKLNTWRIVARVTAPPAPGVQSNAAANRRRTPKGKRKQPQE